jgi:hypothetical protein
MPLSADEKAFLIAGLAYLAAALLWALVLRTRARIMLGQLSEIMEPSLWQQLGAPATLSDIVRDPNKRWVRFLRTREYRRQCDDTTIALIDDYRRRTTFMLWFLIAAGILLLIRFWPLLVALVR